MSAVQIKANFVSCKLIKKTAENYDSCTIGLLIIFISTGMWFCVEYSVKKSLSCHNCLKKTKLLYMSRITKAHLEQATPEFMKRINGLTMS